MRFKLYLKICQINPAPGGTLKTPPKKSKFQKIQSQEIRYSKGAGLN